MDLTDINKYVGYQSKNLKVTLTKTGGYLKKLVNEVTMIQRTMFPVRFYSFDRVTGELKISNKPGGTVKHCLSN